MVDIVADTKAYLVYHTKSSYEDMPSFIRSGKYHAKMN